MRQILATVCWLLSLPALTGCGEDADVFAVVGGESVPLAAYQRHLSAVTGEPWQGVTNTVASRLLDQFLDQEVVAAAARRQGQFNLPLEPGERSARVRGLLESLCGSPKALSEEMIEEGIRQMPVQDRPARAKVRQMLLDSRAEAEAARRQLDEGADFVELSKLVSRAPNAEGGGDLGFLQQGSLSEDLDVVIFSLATGEISEPVPGPSGFHIFQVLEAIPAGPPPKEEIEPEVVQQLEELVAREHATECVRRLAGEVGVTVIRDHLWFDYDGRYAGQSRSVSLG
jgi:hypothetical protein